jgi:hypothetical protein
MGEANLLPESQLSLKISQIPVDRSSPSGLFVLRQPKVPPFFLHTNQRLSIFLIKTAVFRIFVENHLICLPAYGIKFFKGNMHPMLHPHLFKNDETRCGSGFQ